MLKKLKKHFNKILIACLTLISSIALFSSINNTYAYESTQFTYTIDTDNYTFETINNINGIKWQPGSSYDLYLYPSNSQNIGVGQSYILINYYLLNYSNQFTFSNSTKTLIVRNLDNVNMLTGNNTTYGFKPYNIDNTNLKFTMVIPLASTSNYSNGIYLRLNGSDNLFLVNIDIVPYTEIGLQQYYDLYYGNIENNYNQLQQDYNTLENNYNDLQEQYEDLRNDYNTLEVNYNTLQDNYDTLQNNYNSINDIYKYGSFAFIDEIYIDGYYYPDDNEGDPIYTTLNVIQDKQDILANIKDDSYDIYELNNTYPLINATIQFNFNNLYLGYLQLKLKSPSYNGFIEYYLSDENNQTLYYRESIEGNITIDIEHLKTFNSNITTNYKLTSFRIDELYNGDMYNYQYIEINTYYANVYNTAFTNGVNEGKNQLQPEINYLNNEIETLQQQITSQELTIRTITDQYNELVERYNNITNGNNDLYSMIIAVADTPLRIFTQIFNFDILGINISGFILSIISLLVIIWLIKKII